MKVVIIEDERFTANDLKDILLRINPEIEVSALLASVKEAINYFHKSPAPDLIFSDIQLGDGLSFDIFQDLDISVPIIFCTAYNEYALNAFETNGIHYILKPFDEETIRQALNKYENLRSSLGYQPQLAKDIQALFDKNTQQPQNTSSILVYHKDRVIPIRMEDIALFYIKNGVTHLYTFDGKSFLVNKTLEEVQQSGKRMFYRANRQFVINRKAVESVSQRLSRKASILLNVPFQETITVSKEKITDFLKWLEE